MDLSISDPFYVEAEPSFITTFSKPAPGHVIRSSFVPDDRTSLVRLTYVINVFNSDASDSRVLPAIESEESEVGAEDVMKHCQNVIATPYDSASLYSLPHSKSFRCPSTRS